MTSVLPYALWPSLTFAVGALWVAAMLDIRRHTRRGTFSRAGLLGMAALISVVAVVAVAGISAVFAAGWVQAVSNASLERAWTGRIVDEDPARAYIFSFGLENASYASPADPTGAGGNQNRAPR